MIRGTYTIYLSRLIWVMGASMQVKPGKWPSPKGTRRDHRPLPEIIRIKSMNILGVTIIDDQRATNHVDNLLASCSQSLRVASHAPMLHSVARATTGSCMPPQPGGDSPMKTTGLAWIDSTKG